MLKEIRNGLVDHFTGKIAGGYPKTVRAYSGEINRIGECIDDIPAVFVHLPETVFKAKDTLGKILDRSSDIEILCVVGSYTGSLSDDLMDLMDWVIEKLQGETMTADGTIYPLAGGEITCGTSLQSFGEVGMGIGIVTIKIGQTS